MRKGGTDFIMNNRKSTSAEHNVRPLTPEEATKTKDKAANRVNYTEPDTGQYKEAVNVMVQVVDDGKQGTITQEKVDVERSASETGVTNQHEAVDDDTEKETEVTKMLYDKIYS